MLAAAAAAGVLVATAAAAPDVSVTFDWSTVVQRTHTAATVEVDFMPFLGRKSNGKKGGGPHE